MEKLTARSYIEKRIQKARSWESDANATSLSNESRKSTTELAREVAEKGFLGCTASLLEMDKTLSASQKGPILARAYSKSAEEAALLADRHPNVATFRRVEQQYNRIAQGLTRAAKRAQNS